jgi:hypothetical protein
VVISLIPDDPCPLSDGLAQAPNAPVIPIPHVWPRPVYPARPRPIVVVNLSPYHCDVFLIERYGIGALGLQGLSLEEAEEKVDSLSGPSLTAILDWLSDLVA